MMLLLSVLLNSLWEGAVIAFVAWVVLRIARNANATTRYLVWTYALVATVALPVVTAFAIGVTHAETSAPKLQPAVHVAQPIALHTRIAPLSANSTAPATSVASPPRRLEIRLPQNLVWGVIALWGALALFQLVRFVFALGALERLKRNATPLPIAYRDQLQRWNSNRHSHAGVRLCVSDDILVPIAVGLFDAMILIPESLLQRLQADDVDRILLHEFAHLRRRDDWIHAFQRVVSAVLFFNPAVAFIANHMDLEREVSCDDSVLERDGLQPVPYATCLTKMAEIVAWPYAPLAAPGVFNTRRNLSIRVERLLTSARDNRTRVAAVPALAALLLIAAAGVAGASVSPAFAFAIPAVEAKAHAVFPHVARRAPPRQVTHTAAYTQRVQKTLVAAAAPTATPTPEPKVFVKTHVHLTRVHVNVRPQAKVRVREAVPAPQRSAASRDPDYIQELANEGYTGLSIDELVQLRGVGVDAQYIRGIANAGFGHVTPRELIELRGVGVTPDYIAQMRSRFSDLTLQRLIEMRGVGVTPEYIDEIAKAGYPNLSSRELVEMRGVGIDGAYIRNVLAHGFHNVTVRQLIEMKGSGIL
jgi:beta-lactamase regulating signal transducer with metallopeptidase domain